MVAVTEAELKQSLIQAGVHFYHAMDLRGTAQYLANGGIICRSRLREVDSEYTHFWSDVDDERRGVLSRIFGNLYDFGAIFARAGGFATPNIYGPVTFVFRPQVFHEMHDLVLTKDSIASLHEPWRAHAITEQAMVADMLKGDRFGDPLALEYQYTESSCVNPLISFANLERIIVDPLIVNGVDLVEHVRIIASEAGLGPLVQTRPYRRQQNLLQIQAVINSLVAYQPIPERQHGGIQFAHVPDWIAGAQPRVRGRLEMWLSYFYNGTVCYVRELQRAQ